jgi:hypothetical protein
MDYCSSRKQIVIVCDTSAHIVHQASRRNLNGMGSNLDILNPSDSFPISVPVYTVYYSLCCYSGCTCVCVGTMTETS